MSEPKEFLGKTLDAAIEEAKAYFGVPREKLEVDIIEDAKTGIFGIVGARKARIRAKVARLPDLLPRPEKDGGRRRGRGDRRRDRDGELNTATDTEATAPAEEPATAAPRAEEPEASRQPEEKAPEATSQEAAGPAPDGKEAPAEPEGQAESAPMQPEKGRGHRQPRERRSPKPEAADREEPERQESLPPRPPLSTLDREKLEGAVRGTVGRLVAPVLDTAPEDVDLSIETTDDRVQVSIHSEDTGLLIGRDGQNLAAVQYLASRIVTRIMDAQVRIQVDAGDYHMRQDTRLQELALSLAEKVKATGKVQTTRPLSAYQRRVIHLALQNDPEIQTRSSGDGALKHVVILRRKEQTPSQEEQENS